MGIGKIAFLAFVDEAVGRGSAAAAGDRIVRGDYFVSSRIGLGFVKPAAWHFRAHEDFCRLLKGQRLMNQSDDEQEAELEQQCEHLVAIVSKEPVVEIPEGAVAQFIPSITIFSNPDRGERPQGLEAIVDGAIGSFREMLRGYTILEPPRFQEVSLCQAARFTAKYVFEHRAIRPTPVRDRTLVIDQGRRIYSIHLYDSPWTGQEVGGEFEAFIASLHLA